MADETVKPRPIYIRWLDSVRHNDSWSSLSEFVTNATYEQMMHHTLGYLISENEHSLLVALSVSSDQNEPNVVDVIQIPLVSVIGRNWVDLPEAVETGKRRPTAAAKAKDSDAT